MKTYIKLGIIACGMIIYSIALPLTKAQYCIPGPPCPNPTSQGYGNSSCPNRSCCKKNEGEWGTPNCKTEEYEYDRQIFEEREINGERCYRTYDQYRKYTTDVYITVYRCQYVDDGSGECEQGNVFYQKIQHAIEPHYVGNCINYFSVTQWYCGNLV